MRKVYELDDHFATGEMTVQPVLLWGANGQPLRERFSKTASEASEYIKSVQPLPGKSIVLVLAMGAYETYGLNRNGDGFNEHPYRVGFKPTCGHRQCEASDGWVKRGELLTDHYKSFEEFGKIYRHHQNKDPSKASGDVIKAFWNPQMHRVELLLGLDNARAPDLVERIADGEYPAVSMGCKIKYDVCTICGHHAPTRADYCEHLKFSMRQVQSSGLQAGALNPTPKFFDISFVIKPADQTGYMMKKVAEHLELRSSAELGERLDRVEEKRAAIRKLSEIEKLVTGQSVKAEVPAGFEAVRAPLLGVARGMPSIDDTTLRTISEHPLQNILSTLGAGGVHLTTAELIKVLFNKAAPGSRIPEVALDAATFSQPLLLALLEEYPDILDQLLGTGALDLDARNIEPEIADKAKGYLEKRSTISEYLLRKIPADFREEQRPLTDTLTVSDPYTGARYKTTRGAAIKADDQIAKQELLKILGGGALLAAGHKVVSSGLPAPMRPLSAGVALLGGMHFLRPHYGPRYTTEEGLSIPVSTELTKASSAAGAAIPLLTSAGLVTALAHDYESRLRNGEFVHDPDAPIYRRAYDQISAMAHRHPAYSLLAGLTAYGLGKGALQKFSEYLGPVTLPQHNAVDATPVDFDKVAYQVGKFLWPRY